MDGFKTFPPEPVVVTLSGTALELTPIRLGELPRLLAVVRPLAEEITSDPDWMALLGRHGDAVLDLLAITTRRERAWINDLSLEDAVLLAAAVFEALEQPDADPAWLGLQIDVLPGVTAMLAAAARAGAPLGHDFCCINLSDNLKPWPVIEKRIRLALEADFAIALYNPRSRSRPEGFARLLHVLRAHCEPQRLLIFARAVATPEERLQVCRLDEDHAELADMRTVVLIGNSQTRRVGPWVYTPRHYGLDSDKYSGKAGRQP